MFNKEEEKVLRKHNIDVTKLLKNDADEVAELIVEACEEQDEQESFILDKCFSKIQIVNKKKTEKEMKKLEEKEKKFLQDILKIDHKVFETESEAKDEAIDKLFNSLSTIGVSQDKDGDYYTNEKGHMIDSILEKVQNT